ncbi:TetR family transcriptional regulator [Actinoplanes teichomyceticus]|uniref:TetR family transcriptional regulator n=1 Tax=Actinoplanes teichomyceticus TaxID=1867 RepID=A0A561VMK1_ACTTI|nr:TetR family transcriptional regulator [Actinoplanes teichomyceticus]TWG12846.1 TetR family transcriptional regulator [Actinoplanes teichomyceticus]GIF13593.1 TetR family transcriptional regulator [Actinoplanes teichomyceticus]
MEATSSYREAGRARLRGALVNAARELAVRDGWENVRMAQVARAAGVSRQTVYNEFGDRAGLAEALALREIERFVADVRARLFEHGGDVRAAGHAAILHTLLEAARNPLVHGILTSVRGGSEDLLPYLTTRSGAVLAAAGAVVQEWASAHAPQVDPATVSLAAESIVRLTISHVMLSLTPAPESADALAEVFVRLLR